MFDRKEADARYRNRHRATINKRIRDWKRKHPKRSRAQNAKYRKSHKVQITKYNKGYRKTHLNESKQYNAEYYKKHFGEYKARLRRWRKENPEQVGIQIHRRRTKATQAGGSYTTEEWKALRKRFGNRCLACRRRRRLTPDHVIPVAKGGTSNIDNIQPLCGPCNSKKATRTTDYRD